MKSLLLLLVAALIGAGEVSGQDKETPALNAALAELEKKVLYHPRPYRTEAILKFLAKGGQRLDYTTAQGAQCAWLIPAATGVAPEKLWIVCGGNGTLALEMQGHCQGPFAARDAWLPAEASSPVSLWDPLTHAAPSLPG